MWNGKEPFEEYLAHYGVKGMKWGVRRSGSKSRLNLFRVPSKSNKLDVKLKPKSSFTEGGTRKADDLITSEGNKERKSQLVKDSSKREKEWSKLYLKRSEMGDREIKLALDRLRLENALAKEVKTAAEVTPAPEVKTFLQKHGNKLVMASKATGIIAGQIDHPNSKTIQEVTGMLDKAITAASEKKKK